MPIYCNPMKRSVSRNRCPLRKTTAIKIYAEKRKENDNIKKRPPLDECEPVSRLCPTEKSSRYEKMNSTNPEKKKNDQEDMTAKRN